MTDFLCAECTCWLTIFWDSLYYVSQKKLSQEETKPTHNKGNYRKYLCSKKCEEKIRKLKTMTLNSFQLWNFFIFLGIHNSLQSMRQVPFCYMWDHFNYSTQQSRVLIQKVNFALGRWKWHFSGFVDMPDETVWVRVQMKRQKTRWEECVKFYYFVIQFYGENIHELTIDRIVGSKSELRQVRRVTRRFEWTINL